MIPQTINQSKCRKITHNEQQLVGICQNRFCENHSRRACMDCLQQLHLNDKGFQLSDVMTFDQIQTAIEQFKQKRKQENANLHQQCQIHKFLLLKEIQEYISYWQKQYESWDYIDTILQQINTKLQDITLESYVNLQSQNIRLYQFLDEQIQIELNDIELILGGGNIGENNEIKNDLIDNFNEILNKLLQSTESNIQMSTQEMHEFMVLQQKDEYHVMVSFEKLNYFYPLIKRNNEIDKRMNQLKISDAFARDYHYMKKICRMGLLYKSLKNYDQSIWYFNKLIDFQPQNVQAYAQKAEILVWQGNIKEAIQCLDQCIKINPKYYQAYSDKGVLLDKQGNIQEAIECLDQCIKINPKNESAYIRKTELLHNRGYSKKAIECLDQCIKINPKYQQAYKDKADLLKWQSNIKEAIECLDQCIKINPKNEQAYMDKAKILQEQANIKEAIECLDQCIQIHHQGNIKEAIECLDQCIKINPKFELAYQIKVKILEDQGNIKEAIECLVQFIKINPKYFLDQSIDPKIFHEELLIQMQILAKKNQEDI